VASRAPGRSPDRGRARALVLTLALSALSLAGLTTATQARAATPAYAPLNQPGPPLSVPLSALRASLYCEPSVTDAKVEPVLLNPATGVTAAQNYSWNWEPALNMLGIPWCAYTAPYSTLGNIETSGEYLVYAIRTMYAMAHRKITIMGHSQGGMSMRWPLRFWPDTRSMVNKVIGFSGSNHGTTVASASECAAGCPPADWQQIYESNFIRALNSYAETFPGISYTEIFTHTDEVVQPNSGPNASAALHTGGGEITNVATQDVCPNDRDEHLEIGTVDPVAYALAVDALTHSGPADPARISQSVCSEQFMPGVNPADANTYLQILEGAPGLASVAAGPTATGTTGAPVIYSEPPLACYVFATCTGAAAPTLRMSFKRHRRSNGRSRVKVHITVLEGGALEPVSGVTIRLAGHTVKTNARGNATLTVRLSRRRVYRITATSQGCNPAAKLISRYSVVKLH
jgi:hypothetical protein